jgi:hypothetical protein
MFPLTPLGARWIWAWNNAPPVAELRGSAWNKGDRGSWETAINQRAMGQNEDNRIYKQ